MDMSVKIEGVENDFHPKHLEMGMVLTVVHNKEKVVTTNQIFVPREQVSVLLNGLRHERGEHLKGESIFLRKRGEVVICLLCPGKDGNTVEVPVEHIHPKR